MNNSRGQLKLSFGMIFSIILIIAFMTFAFYAIKMFLGIQCGVLTGSFVKDLQSDVDNIWSGHGESRPITYNVCKKIKKVCFADCERSSGRMSDDFEDMCWNGLNGENLFFYPFESSGSLKSIKIEHINLDSMIKSKNPFCIDVQDGKLELTISKSFGENFVLISE